MGKTSIAKILAERYTLGSFIAEEVDNPHLPAYYHHLASGRPGHNPHAYPLHLHLLEKRLGRERHVRFVGNLIISDRFLAEYWLVFVGLSSAAGLLTAAEGADLERRYALAEAECLPVDVVYLLRCEREENLRRIRQRAREAEAAAFSTAYFDRLCARYADLPRLLAQRRPAVALRELDVSGLGAEAAAARIAGELRRL